MAAAATAADAVDGAAAAREEAAPGRHAGGTTAGGGARPEVRNGSLPGTVEETSRSCSYLVFSHCQALKT